MALAISDGHKAPVDVVRALAESRGVRGDARGRGAPTRDTRQRRRARTCRYRHERSAHQGRNGCYRAAQLDAGSTR